MKKNTIDYNLVEISNIEAQVLSEGFKLLSLHKKLFPQFLIPRSLFSMYEHGSAHIKGGIKEAYEWLFELIRYLLVPHLEVIDQEIIKDSTTFRSFISTLDECIREELEDKFLDSINNSLEIDDPYECFDDIPDPILDNFMQEEPLRVSTVASIFFNSNFDFLIDIEDQVPLIASDLLNISCDLFLGTIINYDASDTYHSIYTHPYSLTILTHTSTQTYWHNLTDSIYIDDKSIPGYFNSLKQTYSELIKERTSFTQK